MRKALFAHEVLSLVTSRERAESVVGDLTEEGQTRGTAWFWSALAGVSLAMFFAAFSAARGRMLRLLGLGLVLWLALYTAVRVVGTLLGLQPLVMPSSALASMSPAALAYLAAALIVSSFLAGLGLGLRPSADGMNRVAPLAMFFAVTALVAPFMDLFRGTATWFCTLIYVVGVPMFYVLPLLSGGAVAARGTALARQAARR